MKHETYNIKRETWIMNHFRVHDSRFRIHVSGFTMIELMVTIGIFALITGAVLANFRAGERGESLRLAAEQLAQDIRRAQNDVLSGKTYQEQSDTGPKEQVPTQGYGISFAIQNDAEHYTFFPPESLIALPKGIVTKSIQLSDNSTANVFFSIGFRPPDAATFFQTTATEGGFSSGANEAIVTLRHTVTNQDRRVTINRLSGKISVE
ncbi:MAG: prepilin-type N-terminal cleavage/methylation domain-containing protein [bacterium]|nr:prepilin-type N-terminal cleavage/methylation domain-containing protein [bacterium]